MAYTAWSVVFGEQPSAAKWNILGTNDAHFYSFVGDNTAWQSWTPSWTNLTVGNATVVAAYNQIGKIIHFRLRITLGSTSSVGTIPGFSVPVTMAAAYVANDMITSTVQLNDTSGFRYVSELLVGTTSRLDITAISGTTQASINSTTPFTWTTSDQIIAGGVYEAA